MEKIKLFDFICLLIITIFLLSFFDPQLLLSKTITTGGDTGSHYPTAIYLKEVLLPKGKIIGWNQGNYAGFPLFYHYFPLPFLIIVLLSYILPMEIAFKLTTVLGTFLLPICIYLAFRLLKYEFPIPIFASLFSLPFLFMEANSMWGANIPSTLAGEFSYSLGISLLFLFYGTLYSGIINQNKILLNSFLVFLMGLSHGYAIIFSGAIGSFFLFSRNYFWKNFKYLIFVYGLAFLLLGFWFIPFLGNLPWVTSYVVRWHISSLFEVFPRILWPLIALTVFALFSNYLDHRTWYFLYNIGFCFLLYLLSPYIGMLDIRFVPIMQIYLTIFGAVTLYPFLEKIKSKELLPAIAFFLVALWVTFNVTYIKSWIRWNYTGFDGKGTWPLLQQITTYLKNTNGGRVVYEHSPLHNAFGTERVFENLPFFAHRNTLEGLYMQSSISSPFVFYIQSEISKVCSGPFPQYHYTSLNLASSLRRLKMFNVTQYIARTPEAKKQAEVIPELKLEKNFDEYAIYRLTSNDGHYVTPLDFQPVLLKTKNWKKDFFEWFVNNEINEVHLVYAPQEKNWPKEFSTSDLQNIPKKKFAPLKAEIKEEIKEEEIKFQTNLLNHPHLIKVSYHPNWKVKGAEKICLVSPSFMLVYPKQSTVRLYFGKTIFNYLGEIFTFAGLIICAAFSFSPKFRAIITS